ncbi:MAG: hypothetical protein K2W82_12190 [Candidatus Obscuribacterales bacterium]|nr:hypothetical protein [Candidatus Obscuribacterales bacterium]
MKAKMPNKPAETAKYLCTRCNKEFLFQGGGFLSCPDCGNINRSELVPIDIRDNPQEEKFYTDDDWHGG